MLLDSNLEKEMDKMANRRPSESVLKKNLCIAEQEAVELRQKVELEKEIQRTAKKTEGELARELMSKEQTIRGLKEQITIRQGLPASLHQLRSQILQKKEEATHRDITIERKEILEKEIGESIQRLQDMCPHTFVLSYDGYEGSYLDDCSDAYHGVHVCVICSLKESSKSTSEDVYDVLAKQEDRLIKRDLRGNNSIEGLRHLEVWQPIKEFLETFWNSAGSINTEWPGGRHGYRHKERTPA